MRNFIFALILTIGLILMGSDSKIFPIPNLAGLGFLIIFALDSNKEV